MSKATRLRVEHLASDFLEDRPRHFHEILAVGTGELAAFSGGGNVALDEDFLAVGQHGSRASAAVAELGHVALFADDSLNVHGV